MSLKLARGSSEPQRKGGVCPDIDVPLCFSQIALLREELKPFLYLI